jgi:hypothetical protein
VRPIGSGKPNQSNGGTARTGSIDTRPRSALSLAGAIPLPRPRLASVSIQESASAPLSEIDRLWEALMRARELSPKGRIEAGFNDAGWK